MWMNTMRKQIKEVNEVIKNFWKFQVFCSFVVLFASVVWAVINFVLRIENRMVPVCFVVMALFGAIRDYRYFKRFSQDH